MKPRLFIIMGLGFWLSSPVALADSPLNSETFSLSGFGTLGGAYNLDGEANFIRDGIQPDGADGRGFTGSVDSRLGLQANWKPHEDFEGVIQLVSKYRYDGSYRPQVTWAFLKYAFTPDFQIRAGRLGYDIYPFAESRDVGYSYVWVRPPVDFFGYIYFSHLDGADLTLTHQLGNGLLKGKLFASQFNDAIPVVTTIPDVYTLKGDAWGGYLDYQTPNWLFRACLVIIKPETEQTAVAMLQNALRSTQVPQAVSLAGNMGFADKTFNFFTTGAVYDDGPFQGQLMLSRILTDTLSYPNNTAGYASLAYRIGEWTPYLVYSRIKSGRNDHVDTGLPDTPPFDVLNAQVGLALSNNQADQSTVSLGARYDFAPNAAFKLQVDRIHSRGYPTLLWGNTDPDWDGRATIFSATLDFVF